MSISLDPTVLSAVRLPAIFAGAEVAIEMRTGVFDLEFLGGLWDMDQVPGAQALYGSKTAQQAAIVKLYGARYAQWESLGGKPIAPPFLDIHLAANANRVARAMGLPQLFGAGAVPIEQWLQELRFAEASPRDPREHFLGRLGPTLAAKGIRTGEEGLLLLEIHNEALVEANRISPGAIARG